MDRSRTTRRTLLRLALGVGLLGVVVVAVDQLVPGAGRRLGDADPGWLAVALVLEVLACLSYGVLFEAVFSRAPWRLPWRRAVEIGVGELGAFAILPTGAGGPALRLWALRTLEVPWRPIIARSVAHFAVFNLPYIVAAVILGAGVSLHLLPGHAPLLTALAPSGIVLVSLALAAAAALAARAQRPGERAWRARARYWLATIPDGLLDVGPCLRRSRTSLTALGWWTGDCAALWAAFQAVGGRPAITVLVLAYMLGQLGTTLPLPGGVGGVEPLMLGIFAASRVDLGVAGAAIVCYRVIALGSQGVLGALAFSSLATRLRRQAAGASG